LAFQPKLQTSFDVTPPIELRTHHIEHVRRRKERLDALIPRLLVYRGFELIGAEIFVVAVPAFRVDDVERIGRGHQDF